MQEGAVRMGAFALEVGEEVATKLAGAGDADDGGVGDGLAGAEGEIAIDPGCGAGGDGVGRGCAVHSDLAFGERMFEAEEEVAGDDGRPLHRSADIRVGKSDVEEADLGDGQVGAGRGEGQDLADVGGAIEEDQRPVGVELVVITFEVGVVLAALSSVGLSGCVGLWLKFVESRRAGVVELAGRVDGSVFEQDAEGLGQSDGAVVEAVLEGKVGEVVVMEREAGANPVVLQLQATGELRCPRRARVMVRGLGEGQGGAQQQREAQGCGHGGDGILKAHVPGPFTRRVKPGREKSQFIAPLRALRLQAIVVVDVVVDGLRGMGPLTSLWPHLRSAKRKAFAGWTFAGLARRNR